MACSAKVLLLALFGHVVRIHTQNGCDSDTCDHDEIGLRQTKATLKISGRDDIGPLQNFEATAANRYPIVFVRLQELLDDPTQTNKTLKLLSFGCSDGSEARSLRTYFPNATIHGVDIDADLIAKNSADNSDPLITYYNSTTPLAVGSYDAVLAMGVLCFQGYFKSDHLPYPKFEGAMKILDQLLRPGGFITLYNADYPFAAFSSSSNYVNMCAETNFKGMVPAADLLYDLGKSTINFSRGMCSASDKYCIESGWGRKYHKQGTQAQNESHIFRGTLMSNGCKHPGTFFKKM